MFNEFNRASIEMEKNRLDNPGPIFQRNFTSKQMWLIRPPVNITPPFLLDQRTSIPPETQKCWAVMPLESSLARKTAVLATSSARINRLRGI